MKGKERFPSRGSGSNPNCFKNFLMLPFIAVAGARRDRQVRSVIPTESTRQMRLKEFKGPRLQEAEVSHGGWVATTVGRVDNSDPQGEGFSSAHTADSWRNRERLPLVRETAHEEFLFKQPFLPTYLLFLWCPASMEA